MNFHRSHLRPDGSTWPPVTPDPPPPPGYVDPVAELDGTLDGDTAPSPDPDADGSPDAPDLAESA